MSREWKPGDVAMVTFDNASIAMRSRGETDITTSIGLRREDDWALPSYGTSIESDDARPLVVIDPEDRKQRALLLSHFHFARAEGAGDLDALAIALREFANPTPPKPAEPTGLGAVVEDAEGCQWVRTQSAVLPWFGTPDATDRKCFGHKRYADLSAVRVLSEGVSA